MYPLRSRTLKKLSEILVKNTFSTMTAGGCLVESNKMKYFNN